MSSEDYYEDAEDDEWVHQLLEEYAAYRSVLISAGVLQY